MQSLSRSLRWTTLFLLLFAFALAACGGGDEAADDTRGDTETVVEEAAPTEAPTEVPTAEPTATVEPTATPEPTAVPDPTEGFAELVSEDTGLTLRYPAEWVAEDSFGLILLASSEEVMAADEITEGAGLVISAGPEDDFEADDPNDVVQSLLDDFLEDAELTAGPDETTIAGYEALTAEFIGTNGESEVAGKIFLLESGDRIAVALGLTTPAGQTEYVSVFDAIVGTIQISDVVVEEPVVTDPVEGQVCSSIEEGFLLYGDEVDGTVASADVSSAWSFIGLEGEVVDIVVSPVGDLDMVVDVVDESCFSILASGEVDNSFGEETIEALTVPTSGTFYITVRGFAGETGDYSLAINEAGTGTAVAPGSVDLVYDDFVTGELDSADAEATWTFGASAGDLVDITAAPEDIDSDFDLVLDLLGPDGRSVLADGSLDLSFDTEYIRTLRLEEGGIYTIVITGFDGAMGEYELTLAQPLGGDAGAIIFAGDELDSAEDEHTFPFYALEDDRVVFAGLPQNLDTDIVVELWLDRLEEEGEDELLVEQNFSTGLEEIEYIVPDTGNYYFLVKSLEDAFGPYEATIIGSERVILETAVGDEIFGRFGSQGYIEYDLGATPGDVFLLTAETVDDIDLVIEVLDFDGNVLASIDDAFSGESEQLTYTYEGEEDGVVIVRVSEFFGETGEFTLLVESN